MNRIWSIIKKHTLLILILVMVLILIALYHEILTPFVIALIVVYLIDPMVTNMSKAKVGKRHIPRGLAVLTAYLVFFLTLTGIGFAFVPSLTEEISQATEELPKYFTHLKNEDIPRWNRNIDSFLFKFSLKNKDNVEKSVIESSQEVGKAIDEAYREIEELTVPSVDTTGAKPLLVEGERSHTTESRKAVSKTDNTQESPVLFTLYPRKNGAFEVRAGERDILIQAESNGSYTIKPKPSEDQSRSGSTIDFEKEIDKALSGIIESGTKYAGDALSLLQYVIEFIINTFVQLILVFMVAAFISIDSPKIMKSIRQLFADEEGNARLYDEYKKKLMSGLSGVVRGQLIICCINGTLTGIGLAIFGVNFALLLGIIAGLFSIVPIFGTIISTIPAVLLGLVQGPWTALLVLLWILLVHALDTNFFTPRIVGSSANLHPVVIIFALLAGQVSAGVLGLILAVPVASMIQTSITFGIEQARKRTQAATETTLAYVTDSGSATATVVGTEVQGNLLNDQTEVDGSFRGGTAEITNMPQFTIHALPIVLAEDAIVCDKTIIGINSGENLEDMDSEPEKTDTNTEPDNTGIDREQADESRE